MSAIAVIPARGGSKGVVRKNIAPIAGKPLLVWTIEAAKGCSDIERVIVSSDDEEILSVAAAHGAEALSRPAELASDTARPELVFKHALDAAGALPEYAVYLQPTSPLRTAAHLSAAFALLKKEKAAAIIAVKEIDNKPLKTFLVQDGFLRGLLSNEAPFSNRQLLPPLYMPNGALYIVQSKDFLEQGTFLPLRTLPFVMSPEESIDIDSPQDMQTVEALLLKRQ